MKLKGIAASNGIAIAKVYKLEHLELDIKTDLVENVQVETEKFKKAIETSQKELEIIRDKTSQQIDEEHAAIFDAHIQIINDPELHGSVLGQIENDKANAAFAFDSVTKGT